MNRFYTVTLLVLLASLGFLTYQIFSPFFKPVAWAVVFTIVFYPVYAFISGRMRVRTIAALLTILLILVIIIAPFIYLTFTFVDELQTVASRFEEGGTGSLQDFVMKIQSMHIYQTINAYTGIDAYLSGAEVSQNVKDAGKWLVRFFSLRITDIVTAMFNFIIMIFTAFFFLKDGPGFLSQAKDYLPFSEGQKDRLTAQIKDMIVSTVYGGVAVAIIQGILGGIAYFYIGIEAPVMWGFSMAIMSFVPLLGTFAIWGPTSVYLLIQGDYVHGIGLFLFGVLIISMVDNILKPLIIGSRTRMHTLIILFSVLGGIKLFGMIGLIMGPLITAVFVSVFEIFRNVGEDAVNN